MTSPHSDESEYTPARVHIVKDDTKPSGAKRECFRSTIKSYSLDNVNQPTVQIAPFNKKRYKLLVTTNDTSVVITQDNPGSSTITTTAATAPQGASLQLGTMGNGFDGYEIYGPDPVWAVSIQGNAATRVNVIQTFYAEYED